MSKFSQEVPRETNVIVSLFSLHHLPTAALRDIALGEIAKGRDRTGAAMWVFDLARPRCGMTMTLYPSVFSPGAQEAFQRDSINSLKASWTFKELSGAIYSTFGNAALNAVSRGIPLYQVHWVPPHRSAPSPAVRFDLQKANARLFRLLQKLLPTVPLAPVARPGAP